MTAMSSYTLYAVRGDGTDVGILGTMIQTEKGWRFIPNVAGRSPSRRFYKTASECVPRWTGYPDRTRSEKNR